MCLSGDGKQCSPEVAHTMLTQCVPIEILSTHFNLSCVPISYCGLPQHWLLLIQYVPIELLQPTSSHCDVALECVLIELLYLVMLILSS